MLRPHTATYMFVDGQGRQAGQESMAVARRPGGWLVTSRLAISAAEAITCEVEWHLQPDLSTHVLYMSSTDRWGDEYTLEAAVSGNGLLASRTGPDGPTQVEMGWGPAVELDHLGAAFTTVILARWDTLAEPLHAVTAVYIGAEDLVPEPLEQQYRVVGRDPADSTTTIERVAPATGTTATITVRHGGIVLSYQGLFRVAEGWAFTD